MVIARMLMRGGLLTLALTAVMATAKVVCRMMRSPLPDAEPQRTRYCGRMAKAGLATGGSQKAFPPHLLPETDQQIGRQGDHCWRS